MVQSQRFNYWELRKRWLAAFKPFLSLFRDNKNLPEEWTRHVDEENPVLDTLQLKAAWIKAFIPFRFTWFRDVHTLAETLMPDGDLNLFAGNLPDVKLAPLVEAVWEGLYRREERDSYPPPLIAFIQNSISEAISKQANYSDIVNLNKLLLQTLFYIYDRDLDKSKTSETLVAEKKQAEYILLCLYDKIGHPPPIISFIDDFEKKLSTTGYQYTITDIKGLKRLHRTVTADALARELYTEDDSSSSVDYHEERPGTDAATGVHPALMHTPPTHDDIPTPPNIITVISPLVEIGENVTGVSIGANTLVDSFVESQLTAETDTTRETFSDTTEPDNSELTNPVSTSVEAVKPQQSFLKSVLGIVGFALVFLQSQDTSNDAVDAKRKLTAARIIILIDLVCLTLFLLKFYPIDWPGWQAGLVIAAFIAAQAMGALGIDKKLVYQSLIASSLPKIFVVLAIFFICSSLASLGTLRVIAPRENPITMTPPMTPSQPIVTRTIPTYTATLTVSPTSSVTTTHTITSVQPTLTSPSASTPIAVVVSPFPTDTRSPTSLPTATSPVSSDTLIPTTVVPTWTETQTLTPTVPTSTQTPSPTPTLSPTATPTPTLTLSPTPNPVCSPRQAFVQLANGAQLCVDREPVTRQRFEDMNNRKKLPYGEALISYIEGAPDEPVRGINLLAATEYCAALETPLFVLDNEQWTMMVESEGGIPNSRKGKLTWEAGENRARIGDNIVLIPAEVVLPTGGPEVAALEYIMRLDDNFKPISEFQGSSLRDKMGFRCVKIVKSS